MDVYKEAQLLLREARYKTTGNDAQMMISFEDSSLAGFIFVISDVKKLLSSWSTLEKDALKTFSEQIRNADEKAWNLYSIFLTPQSVSIDSSELHDIEMIDETFQYTRKIARAGIKSKDDLKMALLPLLPIRDQGVSTNDNFKSRVNSHLAEFPSTALEAFHGNASAEDVAKILAEPTQ